MLVSVEDSAWSSSIDAAASCGRRATQQLEEHAAMRRATMMTAGLAFLPRARRCR